MIITFTPLPDITAFELAIVAKNVQGMFVDWGNIQITKEQWDNLDEGVRRHFKENPPVTATERINNWLAKW